MRTIEDIKSDIWFMWALIFLSVIMGFAAPLNFCYLALLVPCLIHSYREFSAEKEFLKKQEYLQLCDY